MTPGVVFDVGELNDLSAAFGKSRVAYKVIGGIYRDVLGEHHAMWKITMAAQIGFLPPQCD